jgi:hypothetical protein
MRFDGVLNVSELSWWIYLLPPAWFAGFDDAFSGSAMFSAWLLAALAVGATALVLWLAFGKLARDYETGLQALNETVSSKPKKQSHRRWLDRLVNVPPLSWWLHDPVARASFLLTAAYLLRDRDVKLRVYPGIAPILIMPFIFLVRNRHGHSDDPGFGIPFSGIYLGLVPLLGLQMLQYSQQWQAADIFRAAPMSGPAPICHGARRAVLCLLGLPMMVLVGLVVWLLLRNFSQLALLLPGIIALPVFALVPNLSGHGVPLSQPTDAAKSAGRGLSMMLMMFLAFGLAGLASFAWSLGWFWWLVSVEAVVAVVLYSVLRLRLVRARWPSME